MYRDAKFVRSLVIYGMVVVVDTYVTLWSGDVYSGFRDPSLYREIKTTVII